MTRRTPGARVALLAGGVGFASLALATAASAAPFAPTPPTAGDAAAIERVAGGCGPGFHPNPWGECRPNGYGPRRFGGPYGYGYGYGPPRPRPFYRPYGFYGPRPYY